jgi:DNA-directed RNA polymerase specialized sigma24 family protein
MNILNQAPPKIITELLEKVNQGDEVARNELLEIVYPILDRIARKLLRSGDRAAGLIRPSDLLNEAVYRIINPKPELQDVANDKLSAEESEVYDPRPMVEKYCFENRAKFFAFVGKIMRNLITDRIRSTYGRKGDDRVFLSLTGANGIEINPEVDWIPFDEALERLKAKDEGAARVVELRILFGFTIEETAEALDVHRSTVVRDFRFGKAFITKELNLRK